MLRDKAAKKHGKKNKIRNQKQKNKKKAAQLFLASGTQVCLVYLERVSLGGASNVNVVNPIEYIVWFEPYGV